MNSVYIAARPNHAYVSPEFSVLMLFVWSRIITDVQHDHLFVFALTEVLK